MDKSRMVFGDLSDKEMAHKVAMLMRNDLNHEAVLAGARDRIRYLSEENESLRAKLAEAEKDAERYRELIRRQIEEGFVTMGELHSAIAKGEEVRHGTQKD